MNAPARLTSYSKKVYRNFATAHPSQDLMDDLVDDEKGQKTLQDFFYDPDQTLDNSKVERTLNRSLRSFIQEHIDSRFLPQNWLASRFSDGSFGVLYAAEDEDTALEEVIYHLRRFLQEELKKMVMVDRRVVTLLVSSRHCADLVQADGLDWNQLTSLDESGYPYCRNIAKEIIFHGAQMLRFPSARKKDGICLAIFDKTVIDKDEGHLKYLKLILTPNTCEVLERSKVVHCGPSRT